jgi:hypothetical protein
LISKEKNVGSKFMQGNFKSPLICLTLLEGRFQVLRLVEPLWKKSKPKDCKHDDHRCHLEALKTDKFGEPQFHYNKRCPCMPSDFIGFWVNSLVVMNQDLWRINEFIGLMNKD